jgi:hypothetical protein
MGARGGVPLSRLCDFLINFIFKLSLWTLSKIARRPPAFAVGGFVWVNNIKNARVCVRAFSKRGTLLRPLGAGCDRGDTQRRRFTGRDNEVHASKRSMRTRARDFAFVRRPEQT